VEALLVGRDLPCAVEPAARVYVVGWRLRFVAVASLVLPALQWPVQHLDVITGCQPWDWKEMWRIGRLGLSVLQAACLSLWHQERSAKAKRLIQRGHVDVSFLQTV
jgi:hypothetical protein